ncbi:MAG: hypothetical protein IKI11_05000, partial [Neisseriaceae bacterium]|nr:hypothetical protein [Neisseriaceae bacterium]
AKKKKKTNKTISYKNKTIFQPNPVTSHARSNSLNALLSTQNPYQKPVFMLQSHIQSGRQPQALRNSDTTHPFQTP